MTGRYAHETSRYRELARSGQTPETMIIACCDSRSAPETIFDSGPGELFVVRNVANLVPPYSPDGEFHSTSAALEFAVQSLKVKNILVMGHGRCGGIRAALDPAAEPLSPGDFIGKWMSLVAPAAEAVTSNSMLTKGERQTALERISIRFSLANLRTFPCVQILESKGRIALHGAWFDISTGELWIMNPETGDFERPEIGDDDLVHGNVDGDRQVSRRVGQAAETEPAGDRDQSHGGNDG
jgi:carbonic anhydrase